MAEKIKIGGELVSTATGNKVVDASAVKDESKGNKSQAEFNSDVVRHENEINGSNGLDSRLRTVEELAEISVGGGDIGIGTAADFESDDPSDLAKVPTVGAILGGLNDGIYDVSKRNPTAGPNSDGKFTLDYILSNADTLIPTSWRHGGMIISFVQSSDNKYTQARCMAQNFTTDVNQWQVVEDEPTPGSDNLVKSGGVYGEIYKNVGIEPYQRTMPTGAAFSDHILDPILPAGTIITSLNGYTGRFIGRKDSSSSWIDFRESDCPYTLLTDIGEIRQDNVAGAVTITAKIDGRFYNKQEIDNKFSDVNNSIYFRKVAINFQQAFSDLDITPAIPSGSTIHSVGGYSGKIYYKSSQGSSFIEIGTLPYTLTEDMEVIRGNAVGNATIIAEIGTALFYQKSETYTKAQVDARSDGNNAVIKLRRNTDANLTNVVLAEGELGLATDTKVIKLGNGTDRWSLLIPYVLEYTDYRSLIDELFAIVGKPTYQRDVVIAEAFADYVMSPYLPKGTIITSIGDYSSKLYFRDKNGSAFEEISSSTIPYTLQRDGILVRSNGTGTATITAKIPSTIAHLSKVERKAVNLWYDGTFNNFYCSQSGYWNITANKLTALQASVDGSDNILFARYNNHGNSNPVGSKINLSFNIKFTDGLTEFEGGCGKCTGGVAGGFVTLKKDSSGSYIVDYDLDGGKTTNLAQFNKTKLDFDLVPNMVYTVRLSKYSTTKIHHKIEVSDMRGNYQTIDAELPSAARSGAYWGPAFAAFLVGTGEISNFNLNVGNFNEPLILAIGHSLCEMNALKNDRDKNMLSLLDAYLGGSKVLNCGQGGAVWETFEGFIDDYLRCYPNVKYLFMINGQNNKQWDMLTIAQRAIDDARTVCDRYGVEVILTTLCPEVNNINSYPYEEHPTVSVWDRQLEVNDWIKNSSGYRYVDLCAVLTDDQGHRMDGTDGRPLLFITETDSHPNIEGSRRLFQQCLADIEDWGCYVSLSN